jgi:hypothetical protein
LAEHIDHYAPIANRISFGIGDRSAKDSPTVRAVGESAMNRWSVTMAKFKTATQIKREQYKQEFWPDEIAWTADSVQPGWFRAPRTLPLILSLLSNKKTTGSTLDPGRVYLDLLGRHRDSGVVEMADEGDHSYAAGYEGNRGVRTWKERMKLLENLGFIKSKKGGNQRYKFVLLVHPTIVVHNLHANGVVDEHWYATYRARQIDAKEPSYEDLVDFYDQSDNDEVVVPFPPAAMK